MGVIIADYATKIGKNTSLLVIIYVRVLRRLAPLAVTVSVKKLLLINELTCKIVVTSGSIGGNRLCVHAPYARYHTRTTLCNN